MSAAALMLVRDEADIVATTVRQHLANVDEVIVADNLSVDGTTEILAGLAASGAPVLVVRDEEPAHYQGRKMTALARLALERGHRWALCCDADEVWYSPDGRTIRDFLDGIGREIQFVKAAIYTHIATALDEADDPNPVTRMRWRQRTPLSQQWSKVACRLRPDLEIGEGNHSASTHGVGSTVHALELRHFPYRSAEHFVAKAVRGAAALRATDLAESIGGHWRLYADAIQAGGGEAGHAWFYDGFWSADPEAADELVYSPAPLAF